MEGVASEAASLCGHLQLGNLILVSTNLPPFYLRFDSVLMLRFMTTTVRWNSQPDMNLLPSIHLDISIDGDTAVAFTENVEQRFLAYGWQVLHVDDGDQ